VIQISLGLYIFLKEIHLVPLKNSSF